MSHPSTIQTAVINSGAINHLSFPGAEEGASVVDLLGTVEVTCANSGITIRLTVPASTTPVASTSTPGVKFRMQLGAETTAAAAVAASALAYIKVQPTAQDAGANAAATAIRRFSLPATGTGTANVAVGADYIRVERTAATPALALVAVGSTRYIPIDATTTGRASGAAGTVREVSRSAETSGLASASARTTAKFRLSADTIPTANGVASTGIRALRGADTAAQAVPGSVLSGFKKVLYLDPSVAQALAGDITAHQQVNFSAGSEPQAVTAASTTAIYLLGASTTATVTSAIAAADYGLLVNAPAERLMTVSPQDRRMEVTL